LKHRGEILKKVIESRPVKVNLAQLARTIGYDRTTVYLHFAKPDLDYLILLKYGKALKHDFSQEFPEMSDMIAMIEEPLSDYKVLTVAEALKERDYWKDKYIHLLESYNEIIIKQLGQSNS
jgi:hypothetical protein